ncbi:MAG: biotin/lipoate A/B protein ligase family protein [Gammaproteobacteria bacterium]|nr:biotin/lipoate A/B protein ligase family protein [Gammaproteobacteria bacterium]
MSEQQTWRMIDTGVRSAAENMAMNKTLLEGHQEGITPHTLRFLQFTPCVLLGFHQSAEQELRLDYCKENNIEIQRRMTGGGAIYFDETQIGWELYLDKKALGTADMSAIAKKICEAAAEGMSKLGVDAKFRPRNDIEVDGRKISGTGGAFDGDSILYQGTLLVNFDVERMMKTLRIPAEKLSDKAIASARERVVNLKELLGEAPDMEKVKACISEAFAKAFDVQFETANDINEAEKKLFAENLAEIDTDEWVYQHNASTASGPITQSVYKCDGGLMRASISFDTKRNILKQVWLTGDFFVKPQRIVNDLEAALKDCPTNQIEEKINDFFANNEAEMLMLKPENFVTVISMAVEQLRETETA